MHDTFDVEVDLWKDTVDVFTIEYEHPGECVRFRCLVSSLNYPNQQFWVLHGNASCSQTMYKGMNYAIQ